MTTCYPDSMKVKRDIQRRIGDHVSKYCNALEENFKQYSIESYKRNIENPNNKTVESYKSYYEEQLQKIEDGTANLYKFVFKTGKKFHKVYFLQYEEANDYYNRKAGYTAGSVHCFVDKQTGEVYKPASWKAPAKIVRFDLRLITDREFLFNPNNISWAGSHLYLR